ncbi:Crp/Fnr family transcriptional regulator [Roseovarius sp. 2305UL8-3]|uniref:Crp/Fnr family transcriptional regulator n=1 Tax=Roseovarius conchicola TaxID=3121636 RepID=UPI003528F947
MDFWHFSHSEWFDVLDENAKRILNESATEHHFARRAPVFSPTPNPESAYLLLTGLVSLFRITRDGDQLTMGFVRPGQLFGELPILGELGRETFATALEPCSALSIPRVTLLKIIRQCQPASLFITKTIAEESIRFQRRIETLVFRSVRSRLANVLLEMVEDFGKPKGDEYQVPVRLTQTEFAQLVGASRPSVNIALNELQKDGAILLEKSGMRVVDFNHLASVAHDDLPRNSRRASQG